MRDAVEPIVVQTSKKSTHKFELPRLVSFSRSLTPCPCVFTRFDPKRPAPARGAINHLMVTDPVRLTTLASNNTYNACEDASFQRSIGFEN